MLRHQLEAKKKREHWCRGEYTSSIILRGVLLILLWIFYGLIPYQLDTVWLLLPGLGMLAYTWRLLKWENTLLAVLFIIAATLNLLLIPMLRQGINTVFIIVLIYIILLWDIICVPRKLK